MMNCCTNEKGNITTTGPVDSCMTPGVSAGAPGPLPYLNQAMLSQTQGGSCTSKVKICGKKPLDVTSTVSMSAGDEAGNSPGGVMSGKFKGSCDFKKGSGKLRYEGKKAMHLAGQSGHNGGGNDNVPTGVVASPSQSKVKCMP